MENKNKPETIYTMGPKVRQNIHGWENTVGMFMTKPGDMKDDLVQYTRNDIVTELADALEELVDIFAEVRIEGEIDSFTLQPAQVALKKVGR